MEITLERTNAACPGCGDMLSQLPGAVGVVAGCLRCGGGWLDNVAARWILRASPTPAMRAFVSALPVSTGAEVDASYRAPAYRGRCCPVCGVELVPSELAAPRVTVDCCVEHGTFFDTTELRALVVAVDVQAMSNGLMAAREQVDPGYAPRPHAGATQNLIGYAIYDLMRG